MKSITLRDVARAAGVSTASASRALAGTRVTSELHRRIMAAATRLGYRTNLAARALAAKRSGLIGIAAAPLSDALLAEVIEAAELRFAREGYGVLISGVSPSNLIAASHALMARGVEAILFVGKSPTDQDLDTLQRQDVPWIGVAEGDGEDPSRLDLGQAKGAEIAARYLVELGHERFGVLERKGGMSRRGVAIGLAGSRARLVVAETLTREDGNELRRGAQRLLDSGERPSALVCGGDAEALAALRECSMRGIAVPGTLSIVGFGDQEFARHSWPALTTVRVRGEEIGKSGAEALLDRLAGRAAKRYETAPKLVIRETVGPPSA